MFLLYINTCIFKKDFINNYTTKTDPCLIKSYWTYKNIAVILQFHFKLNKIIRVE